MTAGADGHRTVGVASVRSAAPARAPLLGLILVLVALIELLIGSGDAGG